MMELKRKGHSTEYPRQLNRVQVHQQVLFLSDVLGASGKSLDNKYLKQRGNGDKWSIFRLPKENPHTQELSVMEAGNFTVNTGRRNHGNNRELQGPPT